MRYYTARYTYNSGDEQFYASITDGNAVFGKDKSIWYLANYTSFVLLLLVAFG